MYILKKSPSPHFQIAVLFFLTLFTSYGLIIKNASNQNYRFLDNTLGPIPTAPLNPIFIGKNYDLSGVAVSAINGSSIHYGGAMMISPHYFVTATHYYGATKYNFRNRDGVMISKDVEGGRAMVNITTNGNADLYIGKLSGDGITLADKISWYPVMMESSNQNWSWYTGKQILIYSMNGGNGAGINTITGIGDSGPSGLIGKSIFFNYSGAYTNQAGVNGESGSPWVLSWNGQVFAGGAHSAYSGTAAVNSNYTSISTFIPAFADQIDAYIAESYPNEKLIRQSITNTAPRILGTSYLTLLPGETSKTFNLTVIDDNLPLDSSITLSATSSDQSILPNSSLVTASNAGIQTLQINPLPNISGTVTVTLSASDGELTTTKDYVVIIVGSTTGLPTTLQGGSFESPTVTTANRDLLRPSGSGWIFTGGSHIQTNGSVWTVPNAPSGTQTALLQGYGNGENINPAISQPLNLVAGSYRLSFKAARRTSGQTQPLKISLDDNQVGRLITPSTTAFRDYYSANFTVTTGVHMLRLEGVNGFGDNTALIDQISLVPPLVELPSFVQAGSFEAPEVSSFQYNPSGSGWIFSQGSGIHANGSVWNAPDTQYGTQAVFLQGSPSGLGAIAQTMSLPAGSYSVSFLAARRPSNQIQPIRISINGTQIGGLITPVSEAYETYTSAAFTVAAGQHTIRLEATNSSGDNTTFIDYVRCFAIPAATSYQEWAGRFITLTSPQLQRNADPDGDQISNLLEFALGLNPTKTDVIPFKIKSIANPFIIEYTRPTGLLNTNYIVEYSDNMNTGSWSSIGVVSQIVNDDGVTQTINSNIPISAIGGNIPQRFTRLRVDNN
jgi:hypothetical protein